jgi:hypothetical protein
VWLFVALGITTIGVAVMLFAGPPWRLDGAVVALFGVVWLAERVINPMSTRAWRRGADGEVATARYLADLESDGYFVFHDLRIPGSRANIDHVVIGPSGIFVVDSKNLRGSVENRRGQLWIGGRRRANLLESATWQAHVVQRTLDRGSDQPAVRSLLAIHRAEFPLFHRRLDFKGVVVVPAKDLVPLITGLPAVIPPEAVSRLGAVSEARLRPMRTD